MMFIIETYIAPSEVHGNGVFAGEDVREGQPIWRFSPGIDLVIPFERIAALPRAFQIYMETYGYISPQVAGGMILSCDHAKFMNHSSEANTVIAGETTLASRAIKKGEEITCDYRECCADWSNWF
jgi:hypothetical protein